MRYDFSVSADVAIEKGNRTWCFDRFIYVSKAAYDKEGKLLTVMGRRGLITNCCRLTILGKGERVAKSVLLGNG